MRFRENPVYGRKVFFINPPFTVEKKVIEQLKVMEYEVYIIKDYQYAKAILRNFENAICFINIEQQLSVKEWFNYIKSFKYDDTLKTIFLGIMANKVPEASVKKFIMNLRLPGGYIPLNGETPEQITRRIVGILDINGAKGKRKYLSLTCDKEDALNGYIAYGSKLYSMTFENISSIGISCYLEKDLARLLVKNTLLSNVCLSLGRWSVITQCVVYSINILNGKVTALLLFSKDTDNETKDSLRKFIYDVLNKQLARMIKNAEPDSQDYYNIELPAEANGQDVPDYNAPTEDDSAVEDVEELPDSEEKTDGENTDKGEEQAENPDDAKSSDEPSDEKKTEEKSEETTDKPTEKNGESEDEAKDSTEKKSEE